jgi:DNA-directed RNA polymerase specialized sigma subunit
MDNVFDAAEARRTNPYCESESKDALDPKFDLVGSNLARYRWYEKNLSPAEERELIRRAQAGDEQAKASLIEHFGKTVLEIAGKYYGPSRWLTRDEMAAWGFLGLLEAIRRFDLSRRNGLRAYAEFWIRKFISQATKGKSLGLNGELVAGDDGPTETRADRVLHSNPGLNAMQLAIRAGCSVAKAEEAISILKANRYPEFYSTTDAPADDGDGTVGWDSGSDEPNRDENPTLAGAHSMLAKWDCFNRYHRNPHLVHADAAAAVHNDPAVWAQLRRIPWPSYGSYRHNKQFHANPPRGAYFVDAALRAEELYARRRIKQIGRQGYADELVADDNRPTKYPPRYLYADDSLLKAEAVEHGRLHPIIKDEEKRLNLPPVADAFVQLLQERKNHALRRIEVRTSPGREYLGPVHFKWGDEKNAKLMAARLSKRPTPLLRQIPEADKCQPLTKLLQATRLRARRSLPLPPASLKPLRRTSRSA